MRLEGYFGAAAVTLRRLLKAFTHRIHIAIAYMRRLETAQFALDMYRGRDGVAGAASTDAPNEDACLIPGEQAVGVGGMAKDFKSVYGMGQVFTRMSCAAGDL